LTEKVLDKAASDPEWRQLLIEDPELAMREANFPEAQQLGQQGLPMRPQESEVVGQYYGYGGRGGGYGRPRSYCRWIPSFTGNRYYTDMVRSKPRDGMIQALRNAL